MTYAPDDAPTRGTESPPPSWLGQLSKTVGPDPSILESALRILCARFGDVKTREGFEALPRECLDLAARLHQERNRGAILGADGQTVVGYVQVCNHGLYWATVELDGYDPQDFTKATRAEAEQAVREFVAKWAKHGARPVLPPTSGEVVS